MKKILLSLLVLAAFATAGFADQSHYQRYVVGARAAGMGGAAVAGGEGVDASYYNPAGLAETLHDSLSLSANLYGLQRYRIKNGLSSGESAKSDAFVTIPGALGGIWRLGDRLVGSFSVFQPNRHSTGEITSKDNGGRLYSYSTEDQSMWIGPSMAYKATDSLHLGVSVFGVHSSYKTSEAQANVQENSMLNAQMQFETTSILGMMGAQWLLPYDWRVGLALQSPGLSVAHDGKLSMAIAEEGETLTYFTDDLDSKEDIPMKVAVGIARQRPQEFGYGLDLTYHPSQSHKAIGMNVYGQDINYWIRRHDVVDVNLGGEYYILGKFPIRAGFYTSFSAAKEIERDDALATSDIDLYGATFSIGFENERTAVNLGLNAMYGDGDDISQAGGLDDDGSSRRSDATASEILVTLSTSYYF